MADKSKIEWTDATLNVVTGCTKKRPNGGCKFCYAERLFPRIYPNRKFSDVQIHPERLAKAASWDRPRMIFLNSMGDTFHEKVPDHFIRQIFSTILATPHHIWQVLTKRIDRASAVIQSYGNRVPPNLWIGASAEDQESAEEAADGLLSCGDEVSVRFLSLEPLIAPVNLERAISRPGINWIIVGAESGPKRRPMKEDWVKEIRDYCIEHNIPLFYKQRFDGNKKISCPELDGVVYNFYPSVSIQVNKKDIRY